MCLVTNHLTSHQNVIKPKRESVGSCNGSIHYWRNFRAQLNSGALSMSSGIPGGSVGKESACSAGDAGDTGSVPESGISPGGGHGNPLQYSCLKNPMEGEPGGLQSVGLWRVRHDWSDWASMSLGSISISPACPSLCWQLSHRKDGPCYSKLPTNQLLE